MQIYSINFQMIFGHIRLGSRQPDFSCLCADVFFILSFGGAHFLFHSLNLISAHLFSNTHTYMYIFPFDSKPTDLKFSFLNSIFLAKIYLRVMDVLLPE